MIIKPLLSGETLELRHPYGGAAPLDLHSKLRVIKMSTDELELFREVSKQKAELSAKAAAYSATKLRDELEAAKAAIAADEVTDDALSEVARLAALATDPLVAKAVEREAHAAIQPELARLDSQLIPVAERLIAEVRTGLKKATEKLNFHGLADWIEDAQIAQVASYCHDRIAASHALLDAWQLKSASQGSQAFLADDRKAT